MKLRYLLHHDGRWLAFDGHHASVLEARPRIERATLVLTDFDGAVSQAIALEGSPAHAAPLIEKRLRADGLIDGEAKILIHRTRKVGNGYQALFTAVALDRWQQMFGWAENQLDHCLLVPLTALLWRTLSPGRGVLLHSGRQLVFAAALEDGMVYQSALAFSDTPDDLAMTAAALGDRVGKALGESLSLQAVEVEWIGVLTPQPAPAAPASARPAPDPLLERWTRPALDETPTERTRAASRVGLSFDGQDEYLPAPPPAAEAPGAPTHTAPHSEWLDETLMAIFAERSGVSVRLGPHVRVLDEDGREYRSGLPALAAQARPAQAVNAAASRYAFLAERVLPWASAASLAIAIGLGALGGRWTLAAYDARQRAEALGEQVAAVEARRAALVRKQALPPEYARLGAFVERASALRDAMDPAATLATVRAAAGPDVRILRVLLEPHSGGPGYDVRVDGIAEHDGGGLDRGMQVARFVQRLRDAGYATAAVDPQSGGGRANVPGGTFSYRLSLAAHRAAAGAAP